MLQGKRILLGVGGGIAVYRAVELMRLLMKQGAEVQVVMTSSAKAFVAPLTFEALSGQKVHHDLFDLTQEHGMGHIQLARWADAIVVAPATASLIAKLTHGVADDLLTTMLLANEKPVLLAPAMNVAMWNNPTTQNNVASLVQQGWVVVEPGEGELACGEVGAGRLAELEDIEQALLPLVTEQVLEGQHWVINAGPTVESWDAVRTMSNRASGTLGACLAKVAAAKGAKVTLIAGVGTPKTNPCVQRIDVESGQDMLQACQQYAKDSDVFIGTAAVSDFRFATPIHEKMKREGVQSMQVELVANPDIVHLIANMQNRPKKVIAFAAESSNHLAHAKKKLVNKGVDAIVANDLSHMASDTASGCWIRHKHEMDMAAMPKPMFAEVLIQHIVDDLSEG